MSGRSRTSKVLLDIAEGVFSNTIDMSLWLVVYLGSMSVPQSASGQLWRAEIEADQFLQKVNYETIKHAIANAKQRGWIRKTHHHGIPRITQSGRVQLRSILPTYDEKRVWDGNLHLITYDIPETQTAPRALLRGMLTRLGCGMLQESVWMTPYDPLDSLNDFIHEHQLEGTIIVSHVGQNGSIGDEDIASLVQRIFHFKELNERYALLFDSLQSKHIDHWDMIKYWSILRDDPQLPFVLLPRDWMGDNVYLKLKKYIQK
jgi:DNA-binding transcriptional regulator PaaX